MNKERGGVLPQSVEDTQWGRAVWLYVCPLGNNWYLDFHLPTSSEIRANLTRPARGHQKPYFACVCRRLILFSDQAFFSSSSRSLAWWIR